MMNKLKSLLKTKEVEFLVEEQDYEIIPEPYPARKFMPEWYKALSPKIDKKDKLENSTIKRCAPFLDAMSVGWIIPLAADVEIVTNNNASRIEYKWNYHRKIIESHSSEQLNPKDGPSHPSSPTPPLKFLNYIYIKMPPGYSALFVPPLNRSDPRFECISGMVDDTYMGNGALEYINFPFTFKIPNYTGLIKAGTPLVQLIPIKIDNVIRSSKKANIKKIDEENIKLVEKTRAKRRSHESYYRDYLWKRK